MSQPFIEIHRLDSGEFETRFYPADKVDTIMVAIALASATRVVAEAFVHAMKLSDVHREQIIAQIAEHYQHDLKLGDLGEEGSTRREDR